MKKIYISPATAAINMQPERLIATSDTPAANIVTDEDKGLDAGASFTRRHSWSDSPWSDSED